ncbi:hypothetical protein IC232_13810 [Microvirga sp. BT688]|uniref:hypothetical protein n=1 Tax=Microvirga sp. TaxID=1873136 RepID=UPI0016888CA3|nr:hypothetical protein [Microvirga sp.]MBD2747775.1 hypothetical protein [Microvirga sp.]
MARFRRSAHYRTNATGTTFPVRAHDVVRDEWVSPSPRPRRVPGPASAFSATHIDEPGIIYPNARCPECRERCYFFKASNGGRVFFDTLWPDWNKHPCTISERMPVMDAAPVGEEAEAAGTDALDIGAFARPDGTVIAVTGGEDNTEFLSGAFDFSRKYFPCAWLEMDRESGSGKLTVLDADLKPVEVKVRRRGGPGSLTDRIRRELSTGMKQALARTCRRIEGLDRKRSFVRTEPGCGTFAVAMVGESRVIVIPVLCDQVRWDWGDFDPIGKYMATTALSIVHLLDRTMPSADPLAAQEHIVFAFHDPFGYVAEGMGDQPYVESDGTLAPSAFDYDEGRKLEERWLGNLRWIDLADDSLIVIEHVPVIVAKAIAIEDSFCDKHWPNDVEGRWRQIEALFSRLGLIALFRVAHQMLQQAGWAFEHDTYDRQSATYHPAESGTSARVLFHRSNATDGICFLIGPDEDDSVRDNLFHVRDAAGVADLVRHLTGG